MSTTIYVFVEKYKKCQYLLVEKMCPIWSYDFGTTSNILFQILQLRAQTEGIQIDDESLNLLGQHGVATTLRYGFICLYNSVISKYSRLSLSRIPRDCLKYFKISVLRHIRFAELRKKLIRLTTFNKYMCNLTPEVRDILKILWKRGEIAP